MTCDTNKSQCNIVAYTDIIIYLNTLILSKQTRMVRVIYTIKGIYVWYLISDNRLVHIYTQFVKGTGTHLLKKIVISNKKNRTDR